MVINVRPTRAAKTSIIVEELLPEITCVFIFPSRYSLYGLKTQKVKVIVNHGGFLSPPRCIVELCKGELMEETLAVFEDYDIRRVFDEEAEVCYFFSG